MIAPVQWSRAYTPSSHKSSSGEGFKGARPAGECTCPGFLLRTYHSIFIWCRRSLCCISILASSPLAVIGVQPWTAIATMSSIPLLPTIIVCKLNLMNYSGANACKKYCARKSYIKKPLFDSVELLLCTAHQ